MTDILTDEEIASLMNPAAAEEPVETGPNVEEFLQAVLTSKAGISEINLSVGKLSAGELPSTWKPVTPSSIISAIPPCLPPTTTRLAAIASTQVFGQFSNSDGRMQTS